LAVPSRIEPDESRLLTRSSYNIDLLFWLLAAPLSRVGLDMFGGIVPDSLLLSLIGGILLRGLSVIKGVELPVANPGLIDRCGAVSPSGSMVSFH
jgi:hypothetical protein